MISAALPTQPATLLLDGAERFARIRAGVFIPSNCPQVQPAPGGTAGAWDHRCGAGQPANADDSRERPAELTPEQQAILAQFAAIRRLLDDVDRIDPDTLMGVTVHRCK